MIKKITNKLLDMKLKLSPYLAFNGNCNEAMNFYNSIFNGTLEIKTFADMPGDIPEEDKGKVMHARLLFNDMELMASDSMRGQEAVNGTSVALSLEYENLEEAERVFKELSDKGTVLMPFKKVFWGATFGMLTDKYGIQWMVHFQ